jgi:4-hydroxy-4-methyl-2-oxoglutarate aldolase
MSSANTPFRAAEGDERLSTPMISDSLDSLGFRDQALRSRLAPLVPGSRLLGRASTVQFAPSPVDNPDGPYDDAISYIDSLVEGDIAVIATGANRSTAYWGELFSAAAIGRSVAGVITDGNVRDSPKIEALGLPVFSAGRGPEDFRARMRIVAVHTKVCLLGVDVDHGDLIMADDDGVVVIPQSIESEVLRAARTRASTESNVLADLLSGASLRTVWDKYKVL